MQSISKGSIAFETRIQFPSPTSCYSTPIFLALATTKASIFACFDMSSYPDYGPQGYATYPPSNESYTSTVNSAKAPDLSRQISRTPSPTPSEAKELRTTGAFDWKSLRSPKFWIRREWLCAFPCLLGVSINTQHYILLGYYVAVVIILILTALMTLYHKQIVHWLRPAADWMHE